VAVRTGPLWPGDRRRAVDGPRRAKHGPISDGDTDSAVAVNGIPAVRDFV